MINETIRRVEKAYSMENIFIIVNETQKDMAYKYIDSRIPRENILIEPQMRGTAMCIFYGTLLIQKRKGDGVISVFSSDHFIENENSYCRYIDMAMKFAHKKEDLVTLGINITSPETRFGYIKYLKAEDDDCYNVIKFVEKPNIKEATEYQKSGQYVWNSGMFFGKIDVVLTAFKKYLPQIFKYQDKLQEAIGQNNEYEVLRKIYNEIESISIDNGIFEKADNVKVIKANFGWSDIGTLKNLFEIEKHDVNNNAIWGKSILRDTHTTNIYSDEGIVIALGVENLSIIKNKNICLICDNQKIQDISMIYELLNNKSEYEEYI